jgi:Ran-binding protein 9/10
MCALVFVGVIYSQTLSLFFFFVTRYPHYRGYHGDDAGLFHGAGTSRLTQYGPKFGCGDTVGCGVDYIQEQIFYTLNGRFLGYAFNLADRDNSIAKILYPVVGVDTTSLVRVNFHGPFCFDLHQMLKDQEPTVLAALRQMEK